MENLSLDSGIWAYKTGNISETVEDRAKVTTCINGQERIQKFVLGRYKSFWVGIGIKLSVFVCIACASSLRLCVGKNVQKSYVRILMKFSAVMAWPKSA